MVDGTRDRVSGNAIRPRMPDTPIAGLVRHHQPGRTPGGSRRMPSPFAPRWCANTAGASSDERACAAPHLARRCTTHFATRSSSLRMSPIPSSIPRPPPAQSPADGRPRRRRLAPLLAGLAMFGPFSIDTIFPAFPQMAAELHASPVAMQQTISVYMIAYALMSLLHGPLSDSFGRRRVILAGVAIFVLASIGCALSGSLGGLLAFRALQGMSAGAGLIVGRAIIRDCFEGPDAQRLMSTVSMLFGIAPALAPISGGWII